MKAVSVLPDIEITVGNTLLCSYTNRLLKSVSVCQRLSMPSQCELIFSGHDVFLSDTYELFSGSKLKVTAAGSVFPLFEGMITAVEYKYGPCGEESVYIRGYDPLYLLGKKQRIYTYSQASLKDIAEEIISSAGIRLSMAADGPVWERIIQYNETDLAFLSRIAQRSGYYFFYRNSVLHMIKPETKDYEISLVRGENLFECSVEANSAATVKSVYSSGWNPATGEFYEAGVSESDSGCDIRFKFPESVSQVTGERKLVDIAIRNSHEAKTVSSAEIDRCSAGGIRLNGVAEGNPEIFSGSTVNIQGINREFCGNYLLTETDHIINSNLGYVSRFNTTLPDFRPADYGVNATFGIVTDVNDPDNMGRIKVVLDSFAGNETDWMNVVLPSAGLSKGLVMLPDTGDRVLVLFMSNDPSRGVILGGVAASSDMPDNWGVSDGAIKTFYFISPLGQKITLDDNSKTVKVENSSGSYIKLGHDKVKIHSEMDLEIEAPGKNITIKGSNIDFKKG